MYKKDKNQQIARNIKNRARYKLNKSEEVIYSKYRNFEKS